MGARTTIGILALQGDFAAHARMLDRHFHVGIRLVKTPEDLEAADALIVPGGESTTIAKLLARSGLDTAIESRAHSGMPAYGTCAGMILLAKGIDGQPDQPCLGLMDIHVARNAFGRQVDSFETAVGFGPGPESNRAPVCGVFIRAPYVSRLGSSVTPLATFQGHVVAAREGALLATAFHPELTDDPRVHSYFLDMVDSPGSTRKR